VAKKKRHHYIPQFYLNGFVDPANPGFIWVYEKGSDKRFKIKPENIAFQTHYYSFDTPNGQKDSETLENILAETESITAPVFERLRSFEIPNDEERQIFSAFLGLMMTRVPAMREAVEVATAELIRKTSVTMASNPTAFQQSIEQFESDTGEKIDEDPETFRKFVLEGEYELTINPQFSLGLMGVGLKLAGVFHQMTWNFFKATDRFKFLTSDNPLYYDDPTHDPGSFYGVGLAHKNTEVTFPISREIAFFGTWRRDLKEGFGQAHHELVKTINRRTVISASRFIFASEKSDGIKKLAQKYKNPGLMIQVD